MDDLVKEVIPLLQYLIPGFLSAWTFYTLTSFKRPDTFGQIVQALIFTFLIHGVVIGLRELFYVIGERWFDFGLWDAKSQTIWSAIVAVSLGLISCYLVTSDRLHVVLRWAQITRKTSSPTEWYSAFSSKKRFVVLHMIDERRLYGWPREWPSEPSQGQFVIEEPAWLNDDGSEISLAAELLVVDATKVQWVEFTHKTW
ncbi:DUF6338 family protein [Pseudomonas putida]|uniref:DUF6338 family protein n=1 Tax=Pseudomonas putida TaxID=303 RepID=UPI00383AA65E